MVIKKDGQAISVAIGEKDDDFVLSIADLLPHLAKEQMEKRCRSGSEENLNLLVGSQPLGDSADNPIKKQVLQILQEKYAMKKDFSSAELQAVPAFRPGILALTAV